MREPRSRESRITQHASATTGDDPSHSMCQSTSRPRPEPRPRPGVGARCSRPPRPTPPSPSSPAVPASSGATWSRSCWAGATASARSSASDPKWLSGLPIETVRSDLHDADALRQSEGAAVVAHVAGLDAGARPSDARPRQRGRHACPAGGRHAEVAPGARVLATSSLEAMGPNAVRDGRAVPGARDRPAPAALDVRREQGADGGRDPARVPRALGVTVVRPPAVYGPREADLYEMVKGAARGLFPVVGDARRARISMVHVCRLGARDGRPGGVTAGRGRDLPRRLARLLVGRRAGGAGVGVGAADAAAARARPGHPGRRRAGGARRRGDGDAAAADG